MPSQDASEAGARARRFEVAEPARRTELRRELGMEVLEHLRHVVQIEAPVGDAAGAVGKALLVLQRLRRPLFPFGAEFSLEQPRQHGAELSRELVQRRAEEYARLGLGRD